MTAFKERREGCKQINLVTIMKYCDSSFRELETSFHSRVIADCMMDCILVAIFRSLYLSNRFKMCFLYSCFATVFAILMKYLFSLVGWTLRRMYS